jgi:murein DD-endopeptidase MepM/ murein hydrolase activator NlpD
VAQLRFSRRSVLLLATVLLSLPATALGAEEAAEAARWTSPVLDGASISQGNEGARTHTHPQSRYAFDYQLAEGSPVVAARDGIVSEVVDHNTLGGAEKRFENMANRVVLRHADGTRSVYVHLMPGGACVRVGEHVIRGELVGYSGDTGYSSGPHLHFAVVDKEGISVPIHFDDFDRNQGVPNQGDHHGPAPKPEISQKDIDSIRARLRAAAHAERMGWPGVGMVVLGTHRPRRAQAEHPLNVELAEARARCERALLSLSRQVRDTPAPDADLLLRLVRAEVAVDLAKAPRALRDELHGSRRALEGEAVKQASGLKNAASRLVKAMAAECEEDDGAAKAYGALLRHGQDPIRMLAQTRFDALVEQVLTSYEADVARLKQSARDAGPQHGRMLLRYAEETLELHRDLLEDASRARTDRGDELKAVLKRMRADEKEISTLLG